MANFETLWAAHPGGDPACDKDDFVNQCAIRMSKSLNENGIDLQGLRTCLSYDSIKYAAHAPGHVLSAQELANHFYGADRAKMVGASSFHLYPGSINDNMDKLKNRKGMIFIEDGWGTTDHIDLWRGDGESGTLRGGANSYFGFGKKIWLWNFA